MFVGHAAVAALAAAARPRIRIAPLLLAAYGADAVEIVAHGTGAGHEGAMMWSHSVTALLIGGAIVAAVAALVTDRARRTELALAVGLVYASHGICDLFTGERKPAWEGGPTYGFGLYQRPAADFVVEAALLGVAAAIYCWRRRAGPRRVLLAVSLLLLLQLGFNLGDRAWLHGLKSGLVRATGAAVGPGAIS